jgi:hypothetical protein
MIRSEKLSPETKAFESTLDREAAIGAIYVDFEGYVGKPPSLIGVAIGPAFTQVVLDTGLRLAAEAKGLQVQKGSSVVEGLLARATRENRRIVAFSQHEKRICKEFYGIDLSPVYADARFIAKKSSSREYSKLGRRPKSLKEYLRSIGYSRQTCLGERQSTQRLRAVTGMCAKRGSYEALTRTVKAKWTKALENNRVDVIGMKELVSICRAEGSRES